MTTSLLENTIALSIHIGLPGVRKKVHPDAIDTTADKSLLHVSKDLFEAPEFQKVVSLDCTIRTWVQSRSLPSLFKSGIYLLPFAFVELATERLEAYKEEREALIEDFLAVYPLRVEQARLRLGVLFQDGDYPDMDSLRDKFTVKWQYLTLGVPGQLERISAKLFKQEQEKARQAWAETTDVLTGMLRTELAALVEHLMEQLTPGPDGARRVFRATNVQKLSEWCDVFLQGRQVEGDAELQTLVAEAKRLAAGVDPALVRKSTLVRDSVRADFQAMKARLDSLLITAPRRRITLEDAAD
jgi:hypothetical protein